MMHSLALKKSSSGFRKEEGILRIDETVTAFQRVLQGQQRRLTKLNQDIQKALGMQRHPLVRLLRLPPFRWLLIMVPRRWRGSLAPFQDPYAFLERELRSHLNKIQKTVIEIAQVAEMAADQKERFQSDFDRAQQEQWTLGRINRWIQEQTKNFGFALDPRVNDLAEIETAMLDETAYEVRRQERLQLMNDLLGTAKAQVEMLEPVGIAALRTLDVCHWQYLGVAVLRQPTTVLSQTAAALTNLNEASLNASQVIQAGLKESLDVINEAVGSIALVKERMAASEETRRILNDGRQKLLASLGIKEKEKTDENPQSSPSH